MDKRRFLKGRLYKDYVNKLSINKDKFRWYYEHASIEPRDVARLRGYAGSSKGPGLILALGEGWCPDVYRGIPTVAKLAEAADIEMRIFPRDDNLDIMDEFLKDGKHRSIPTFVFYTADLQYICHWIEKPAVAYLESAEIESTVRRQNSGTDEKTLHKKVRESISERFPFWQRETVVEVMDLLETSLTAL